MKTLSLFTFLFLFSACMQHPPPSREYIAKDDDGEKRITVFVKGEVRTAGSITVEDGASAWEALQQCGGVNTNYASKNAVIMRKGKYILMQWNSDEFKEFGIEDGDIIGVMSN